MILILMNHLSHFGRFFLKKKRFCTRIDAETIVSVVFFFKKKTILYKNLCRNDRVFVFFLKKTILYENRRRNDRFGRFFLKKRPILYENRRRNDRFGCLFFLKKTDSVEESAHKPS